MNPMFGNLFYSIERLFRFNAFIPAHPRASGDRCLLCFLDSRLRGNVRSMVGVYDANLPLDALITYL